MRTAAGRIDLGVILAQLALVVGASGLVAGGRVGAGTFAVFAVTVFGAGVVRRLLGGDRRAAMATQLIAGIAVFAAAAPVIFPLPSIGARTEESWQLIAHLMLVPTAMLASDLSTRAARLLAVFGGLVLLGAASSIPGGRTLGGLLVAYAAVALAALAVIDHGSGRDRVALRDEPIAEARSLRDHLRRAAILAAVLIVVLPIAAVLAPDPPRSTASGKSPSGDAPTSRYGGFNDTLDTSDRFSLSEDVLLRVRAKAPSYWRATSYDTFDGRIWTRSSAVPVLRGRAFGRFPIDDGEDKGLAGQQFTQTFTIKMAGNDVVLGAYRMIAADIPASALTLYDDRTVRVAEAFGVGAVYTVTSRRPLVTQADLRASDPRSVNLDPAFTDRYLQTAVVPTRVAALAHELADGRGAYDAVIEMEHWLAANTRYTLDIPRLPDGADSVEQFLFVDRAGFCEQIASSLAVMLRAVGIPARVTTGFVAGSFDALSGDYVVRGTDAHAWVEVYFPAVGWQAFDPTANVPLSGEFDHSFAARLARVLSSIGWVIALLSGAVISVVSWLTIRKIRARRRRQPVIVLLRAVERQGKRRGAQRAAVETVRAYTARLADEVLPDERIAHIGHLIEADLYGASPMSAGQIAWATDVLAAVVAANPARRRPETSEEPPSVRT